MGKANLAAPADAGLDARSAVSRRALQPLPYVSVGEEAAAA
jgi:hypothetical protein